jgi:hypothetical protein
VTEAALIYASYAPEVSDWVETRTAQVEADRQAIAAFEERIHLAFSDIDGRPRHLRATLGLITGVEAASPFEQTPDGWYFNEGAQSHVPDLDTAAGRAWQNDFDDLPAVGAADGTEDERIGMPGKVLLFAEDGTVVGEITPQFHVGVEGGVTFVTWPAREIKPVIDARIDELGTGYWIEMPRSVWYARVEYFEALEADEAAAAEEAAEAEAPPAP